MIKYAQNILIIAGCSIAMLLVGCSTTKTTKIKLSGTPGLGFTGEYSGETGESMQVSGTVPMSIKVDMNQLRQVEFRKTGSEGELVMEISKGMFTPVSIVATKQHAGVRAMKKEDGSWSYGNFR